MDDVRKVTYITLALFVLVIVGWIGFIYVSACGLTSVCQKGAAIAVVDRTAIPTLLPATLPALRHTAPANPSRTCQVAALDLIGAWVDAGYPETEAFRFTDHTGTACIATFDRDLRDLFTRANLWYPGSLACAACHGPNLASSAAQLDLSTYDGIVAGSGRTSPEAKGKDILALGNWRVSILHDVLLLGHPPGAPAQSPLIIAGMPLANSTADLPVTATP